MDSRRAFSSLSLSPDGRRLALTIQAANDQIWVYDLERGTLTPQTLRGQNGDGLWTPDSSHLTFASDREGPANLFWQPADGSGPAERLTTSAKWPSAQAWSPDGKTLVFEMGSRGSTSGSATGRRPRAPTALSRALQRDSGPGSPRTDAGSRTCRTNRVAKRSTWCRSRAPGPAGRSRRTGAADRCGRGTATSSTTGMATGPWRWRLPASRPSVRRSQDSSSKPRPSRLSLTWDVTPDGDFLMIEPGESDTPPSQINAVLNWLQELRERR